jgi:photosystem II stability/assembly factor-like uncharacterized protein
MYNLFLFTFMSGLFLVNIYSQQPENINHYIVADEAGKFFGWPANNGVWIWGNEILVGITKTDYAEISSHNIVEDAPLLSVLARSIDGGKTWDLFDPDKYVGDGLEKTKLEEPLDFTHEGFALRVSSDTYHGNNDPRGSFYYSYDKGESWNGPFNLGKIPDLPRFDGYILTPRTDYIVLSEKVCLIFITSRVASTGLTDKTSVIKTTDGGLTFELISPWVVPCSDPHRAAMPNTVRVAEDEYVMTLRRRVVPDRNTCWIDCYSSKDGGKTWEYLSKVGDTGAHNGNPPALVKVDDERLCAIYGNRTEEKILGRYSSDNGKSWNEEFVLRDGFFTKEESDMKDLGYCRLVQNADGELVAIYYWASEENQQQHIAASIWRP